MKLPSATTSLFNEKLLVATLPILVLLTGNPEFALACFIVLGQGHFLMAYLYQYKAGKASLQKGIIYVLLFLFIFSYVIPELGFDLFLMVVAGAFAVHFFFDEARLLEKENHKVSFTILLPPIILFLATLASDLLQVDYLPSAALLSGGCFLISLIKDKRRLFQSQHFWYVNSASAIFILLYLLPISVPAEFIFGAIILWHVATWYVHFYNKLSPNESRLRTYVTEVVLLNIALILLYAMYSGGTWVDVLYIFYDPIYYYGWALLHIIFSSSDLYNVLRNKCRQIKITY